MYIYNAKNYLGGGLIYVCVSVRPIKDVLSVKIEVMFLSWKGVLSWTSLRILVVVIVDIFHHNIYTKPLTQII